MIWFNSQLIQEFDRKTICDSNKSILYKILSCTKHIYYHLNNTYWVHHIKNSVSMFTLTSYAYPMESEIVSEMVSMVFTYCLLAAVIWAISFSVRRVIFSRWVAVDISSSCMWCCPSKLLLYGHRVYTELLMQDAAITRIYRSSHF